MYNIYLEALDELRQQKLAVKKQQKCGIISYIDSANELEMIERKELKIKKDLVQKVHVGRNGTLRTITYLEPKGLWVTKMPDGTKLYGKSEERLYEKLFDWYNLEVPNYTLATVHEKAVEQIERTENKNPETIRSYRAEFQRFITNQFAARDIRSITKTELMEYTQELVHRMQLKDKAFLKYKGVLNRTFSYALETGIIQVNPVNALKNDNYLKACIPTDHVAENNILSPETIDQIRAEVRKRMPFKRYNGYFINGYAILLAIETGMRAGELCSLKWNDVKETYIHIHSQQLYEKQEGGKKYIYAPWTKDERGRSRGGRAFPMTPGLKAVLEELKKLQEELGISSEFVLCHEDGEWIKTDAYETALRRLMQSMELNVTNNHAFRKSLNSNVLIPMGFNEVERSSMLGHSVETNLKFYTFRKVDAVNEWYSRFYGGGMN